jgi:hypothetical protein
LTPFIPCQSYFATAFGRSLIFVVHAGDFISDRNRHSRLKLCTAGTAVNRPYFPFTASSAAISRSRDAVSPSNSVRGRSLGSGLVDHSQKMTVAARAIAEKKAVAK